MAISDIFQAVLDMDRERTVALVTREIAAGADVAAIVNQSLIGADGYGEDAAAAVRMARRLLNV